MSLQERIWEDVEEVVEGYATEYDIERIEKEEEVPWTKVARIKISHDHNLSVLTSIINALRNYEYVVSIEEKDGKVLVVPHYTYEVHERNWKDE